MEVKKFSFRCSGLLVLNYFSFFAPNTHCALVVELPEKASTIQYGYRKWGTRARVFSQTLAHGNSKNEIRQRNKIRKEEERRE